MTPRKKLISLAAISLVAFSACGKPDPIPLPVIQTPADEKVDLTGISLSVTNARIILTGTNTYHLIFDYTITNQKGAHLEFICLYQSSDELIEVNLTDPEGQQITRGRRPLEGLTLTLPRPMKIISGSTTRTYQTPLIPGAYEKGDLITLRMRLHAPSRYDELRSSIQAPLVTTPWP